MKEFLLYIDEIGNYKRKNFIGKCNNDERRFGLPIKTQKIYTFCKEGKEKLTKDDGRVICACLLTLIWVKGGVILPPVVFPLITLKW